MAARYHPGKNPDTPLPSTMPRANTGAFSLHGSPIMPAPTTIPASTIITPTNRQRQTFDEAALLELANSIKTHGLLHALVVRPDGRTLIAGERRLRAIETHLIPLNIPVSYGGQVLPLGQVPVVPVSADDPLALEEIELDENLKREDLTWQEHAAAVARLADLRKAQALAKGLPAPTVAAVSLEVRGSAEGESHETTRRELILAQHLHRPEIAKAKTAKDAFKVLKALDDRERNIALATAVGQTYSSESHQLFQANCLEWMKQPEWQGAFDVICTDPPYGMGADKFDNGAGKLLGIEHNYVDSQENFQTLMTEWCRLSFLVAKPQAHAYVCCDIDHFPWLREQMRAAGWYVFRTPLIHYKIGSGRIPLPDRGPRRQWEAILYAIKGDRPVLRMASDVISTEGDDNLGHGAQKPVGMYVDLLSRSARPGDRVLDTFAGTGTILVAAHELKLYGVAVEMSDAYYGICARRLATLNTPGGVEEALL
jgi:DNA modification methylase